MTVNSQQKNAFLITVFVILWNSGFVGAEYGLLYAGPFNFLLYRYLALTLLIFIYLKGSNRFYWVGWRYGGHQMIIGVLAHGVFLSCVLISVDYGVPVGIVALVLALQPLATGAFAGVVVGEKVSRSRWVGLMVGFSGVAVSVIPQINFQNPSAVFAWLIPLGSVVAITAATLFQRKIRLKKDYPRIPNDLSLFYQSLATTLVVAVPAVFYEQLSVAWNPVFVSVLVWLVLGVSLGAYILMWKLIDRMDATKVASLFYLGPPVTMLMAWVAFGDTVQLMDLVGMALVFVGVLLTYMRFPGSANPMK